MVQPMCSWPERATPPTLADLERGNYHWLLLRQDDYDLRLWRQVLVSRDVDKTLLSADGNDAPVTGSIVWRLDSPNDEVVDGARWRLCDVNGAPPGVAWPEREEFPTAQEVEAGWVWWMVRKHRDPCWSQVQVVLAPHNVLFAEALSQPTLPGELLAWRDKGDWRAWLGHTQSYHWRACTADGLPLPLPVWRQGFAQKTTEPHPNDGDWRVERLDLAG